MSGIQYMWDCILEHEAQLRSPYFPVLFSLSVYLIFCLPFILLDALSPRVKLIRRYKIHQTSRVSWDTVWSCLKLCLYNHVLFIFPVTVLHWLWRPVTYPKVPPGALKTLVDLVGCLLLFDFQYFVWHFLHHKIPLLYRTFHKVHHKYTTTFALATEYSGAWETLSLGFFAGVNPMLLGVHPMTEMMFHALNMWLSVEDHCGYDLPWATHRLVPFGLYGGAQHHDIHHQKFKTNYAPYFTHWDRLFGTLHGEAKK
ncbi:hypothetical protein DNTS_021716 [Danionella cerebrum]|uniref:Fatty acid hydroxylase domain-containing protein n=1 Tax=Danionella cerebrum TaxID=2873325 RepID=A0A553RLI3_9TELE|nr:hypothetical protein DNTS_021716 [Danionella translucida]